MVESGDGRMYVCREGHGWSGAAMAGKTVKDISFNNANEYFPLDVPK